MVRERRDALRAVAKRAQEHPWSPIWRNIDNGHHKAFINEAQPDVVVELLDALEAAERDRDKLATESAEQRKMLTIILDEIDECDIGTDTRANAEALLTGVKP